MRFLHVPEDPIARRRVAVPAVHAQSLVRAGFKVALRHEHLLADHIPSRARVVQPLEQPPFLIASRNRPIRIERLRTIDVGAIAARLIVAKLARIEHVELGQIAELQPSVELDIRSARNGCGAERHVFVVRLKRRGAPRQEKFGRRAVLVEQAGPVVLHLVIVEHDDPRKRGMRGLEMRVALVECVSIAIGRNGHRLGPSCCRGSVGDTPSS